MIEWFKARIREVTTHLGIIMAGVSPVLAQYAAFDRRVAYAGIAIGILLVLFKEKSGD